MKFMHTMIAALMLPTALMADDITSSRQEMSILEATDTYYKCDSALVCNDAGQLTNKGVYYYDENGLDVRYVSFVRNGDSWVQSEKRESEFTFFRGVWYNSVNAYYVWKDGAWEGNYRTEWGGFDKNGGSTFSIYSQWQDGTWVANSKNEFAYDNQNNQTLSASYRWQDGAWKGEYKTESSFDGRGHETLHIAYNWQDGTWVGENKAESIYDGLGNLIQNCYYRWTNNSWEATSKYEASYDVLGHQTMSANYEWKDGAWVGVSKTEHAYDEYGNENLKYKYVWQDSFWKTDAMYKYELIYNIQQQLLVCVENDWNGSEWNAIEKYEYAYNELGQRVLSLHTGKSRNSWVELDKTEWTYDLYGNIASAKKYGPENHILGNPLALISTEEWTYDRQGRMTHHYKYDTTFDYVEEVGNDDIRDDEGNQVYYHWFSFMDGSGSGQEQAYDEHHNITLNRYYYNYNGFSSDTSNKYEYAYDEYGHLTEKKRYYRGQKDGEWQFRSTTYYYWSEFGTGIENVMIDTDLSTKSKVFRNGRLEIYHNGQSYGLDGVKY